MDSAVREVHGFLLINVPRERLWRLDGDADGCVVLEPQDAAFAYWVAQPGQMGFWELAGLLRLCMGSPDRGPYAGYLITMEPRETIVGIEIATDGSSASVGRFNETDPDPGTRAAACIVRSFADLFALALPDLGAGAHPPLAAA